MNNFLQIVPSSQGELWMDILQQIGTYDFYHLPEYHVLNEKQVGGKGVLLAFQENTKIIALPLLIRPINLIQGLEDFDFYDGTSVYGYPGPIANVQAANDSSFIYRFHQALQNYATANRLVTIFSRTNPVFENYHLLTGLGEVISLSETVAINLTIPLEMQTDDYRKNYRYEIRRARREGIKVYHDVTWSRYNDFIQLYLETMQRVTADKYYFFDKVHFDNLRSALGDRLHLFIAELDGHLCSAALFVHTNGIIQYHLSGSDRNYQKLAPSKLIIDQVRQWGHSENAKCLHLGGGVGSQEDNLFRYKAGFSSIRHNFHIWKWVIQPELYQQLTLTRQQWIRKHTGEISPNEFFPVYRV